MPKVDPSEVTDEVWNHIFLDGPAPEKSAIPAELLQRCRREFKFWYPLDLRVRMPASAPCVTSCQPSSAKTCQAQSALWSLPGLQSSSLCQS